MTLKIYSNPVTLVIGLCAEALPDQGIASKTSRLPVPERDCLKKPLVHFQARRIDERFTADAFVFLTIRIQLRPSD